MLKAGGWVILKVVVAVQPFASVTVAVYVPAHNAEFAPVAGTVTPGAEIAYVYGKTPPAAFD